MKDADVDDKMEVGRVATVAPPPKNPRMVTISAFVHSWGRRTAIPNVGQVRDATEKEKARRRRRRRKTTLYGDIHNDECRSSFGGVWYKDGMTKIRR